MTLNSKDQTIKEPMISYLSPLIMRTSPSHQELSLTQSQKKNKINYNLIGTSQSPWKITLSSPLPCSEEQTIRSKRVLPFTIQRQRTTGWESYNNSIKSFWQRQPPTCRCKANRYSEGLLLPTRSRWRPAPCEETYSQDRQIFTITMIWKVVRKSRRWVHNSSSH